MKLHTIILLLTIGFCSTMCSQVNKIENCNSDIKVAKMRGLSFVAPPRAFSNDPMIEVQAVNSDWIAVTPFAYTRVGQPKVFYNSGRQWWGEKPEGIIETIRKARAAKVNVMLKPQVYVPGDWIGTLDFSAEDWAKWEKEYEAYIMQIVTIADSMKVGLFCIGTEVKASVRKRPQFWSALIKKIRANYKGKLTYASNWDNYQNIPFWKELDFIGVDAYFPLCETKTPSVEELKKAWQPVVEQLESYHCKMQKPIVFTEFGYLSVDGCTHKTWELESKVHQMDINETAQANAYQALFSTFWEKNWWGGGFLWKWFPNNQGHEGYFNKDYTPQGKKAAKVLTDWYEK